MRTFRCILSSFALLILIGSVASSEELAKVNETIIEDTYLLKRMKLLSPSTIMDIERFLDDIIDEELFYQEAKKSDLAEREDYKLQVELTKRRILLNLYVDEFLREKNTEENQQTYFKKYKENYRHPEARRVSIIAVKTENEAKEILEKARDGQDFAELAKKYSIAESGKKGGDLGFFTPRGMAGKLSKVVFSLEKGEIGGPVSLKKGYYVIKVTDRRQGKIPGFEEARKKVASDYRTLLIKQKILELRNAAKIYINGELLEKLKVD